MRHTDHGAAAGKRCKTPTGVDAAIDRITHGEGAISELKRHGAGRARCRGTRKLQVQLLLAATAINLKRLISRGTAGENAAAEPDRADHASMIDNHAATDMTRALITAPLTIIAACLRTLSATGSPTSTTGS